jgi:Skp family chaperone for outer membrane proteins
MADKILKEIQKMQKQIEALDKKLDAHISFIESVYNPLSKSIDRFKKIFK